jgi:hypothetical protein
MRYAFALLALLVAAPALAADRGVLIIMPGQTFSGSNISTIKDNEQLADVQRHFRRAGITYTIVRGPACKTWWVRRGTYQLANGDSITHAAVVDVGFQRGRYATAPAGYRPDSLTLTTVYSTVPHIFLSAAFPLFQQTTTCSTGVDTDLWATLSASATGDSTYFIDALSPLGEASGIYSWRLNDKAGSYSSDGSHYGHGTWRGILRSWLVADITTCTNCEVATSGGGYSLWMRTMDHVNGAKPNYFVCALNGLGDNFVREGGIATFALAMASADSFASGAIFGEHPKKLTAAIYIQGLWKTRFPPAGTKQGSNGFDRLPADIVVADSAAIMAQFDSIATRFPWLPITLGGEIDSMHHYPRDYYYTAARLPKWRIAPAGFAGQSGYIIGTNLTVQTPSTRGTWYRPLDMIGRNRARIAIGDGDYSAGSTDSSLAALVNGSFNRIAIAYGRDHVSHTIWAYPNDYAVSASFDAVGADSFFSALHAGGARAFISAVRAYTSHDASVPELSQRAYRVPYGPTTGGTLKLLMSSNGVSTIGADRGINSPTTTYAELFYDGLFGGINHSYYTNQAAVPGKYSARSGSSSILTVDVAHFGTGSNSIANMFGWRYIKYCVTPVLVYNELAGRTLAEFVWPEDVEP